MKINHLSISWSISRGRDTYGYNICRLDSRQSGSRYRCSGGGYDMIGTVFGNWLEAEYQRELVELGGNVGPSEEVLQGRAKARPVDLGHALRTSEHLELHPRRVVALAHAAQQVLEHLGVLDHDLHLARARPWPWPGLALPAFANLAL